MTVEPDWKAIALDLFTLLDNIDTASDIAKSNEGLYRRLINSQLTLRYKYQNLFDPDGDLSQFNQPPKSAMAFRETLRGFRICVFTDLYGATCSVQESSLASENAIWLGCNDIGLKKFEPGRGWSDVQLEQNYPHGISHTANTRMHLDQKTVRMLIPILQEFVDNGRLPDILRLREDQITHEAGDAVGGLRSLICDEPDQHTAPHQRCADSLANQNCGTLDEWEIVPAPEGACPICAKVHTHDEPHDAKSLFYQFTFFKANRRWPNWEDAMSHCDEETKAKWIAELKNIGEIE